MDGDPLTVKGGEGAEDDDGEEEADQGDGEEDQSHRVQRRVKVDVLQVHAGSIICPAPVGYKQSNIYNYNCNYKLYIRGLTNTI